MVAIRESSLTTDALGHFRGRVVGDALGFVADSRVEARAVLAVLSGANVPYWTTIGSSGRITTVVFISSLQKS